MVKKKGDWLEKKAGVCWPKLMRSADQQRSVYLYQESRERGKGCIEMRMVIVRSKTRLYGL